MSRTQCPICSLTSDSCTPRSRQPLASLSFTAPSCTARRCGMVVGGNGAWSSSVSSSPEREEAAVSPFCPEEPSSAPPPGLSCRRATNSNRFVQMCGCASACVQRALKAAEPPLPCLAALTSSHHRGCPRACETETRLYDTSFPSTSASSCRARFLSSCSPKIASHVRTGISAAPPATRTSARVVGAVRDLPLLQRPAAPLVHLGSSAQFLTFCGYNCDSDSPARQDSSVGKSDPGSELLCRMALGAG